MSREVCPNCLKPELQMSIETGRVPTLLQENELHIAEWDEEYER